MLGKVSRHVQLCTNALKYINNIGVKGHGYKSFQASDIYDSPDFGHVFKKEKSISDYGMKDWIWLGKGDFVQYPEKEIRSVWEDRSFSDSLRENKLAHAWFLAVKKWIVKYWTAGIIKYLLLIALIAPALYDLYDREVIKHDYSIFVMAAATLLTFYDWMDFAKIQGVTKLIRNAFYQQNAVKVNTKVIPGSRKKDYVTNASNGICHNYTENKYSTYCEMKAYDFATESRGSMMEARLAPDKKWLTMRKLDDSGNCEVEQGDISDFIVIKSDKIIEPKIDMLNRIILISIHGNFSERCSSELREKLTGKKINPVEDAFRTVGIIS